MRKYLLLYSKRILKILPFVIVVTAILFGSLAVAFRVVREMDENSDMNVKFRVGIVGTAGDMYLSMGLAAFQSMDSTRYSIEIEPMSEERAQQEMRTRSIAAYVVFPDGFMDAAMQGDIKPLKYVSTAGGVDMIALIKDEVTHMVEQILWESQRGTYGVGEALWDNGLGKLSGEHVNDLAIEYVSLVLTRGGLYSAKELGLGGGLTLNSYLLSSLTVLFLLLLCMPYAPLMIRADRSMEQLLASRKIGPVKQTVVEFSVYFISLLLLTLGAILLIQTTHVLDGLGLGADALLKILPVVLCVAAWSYLCYEISRNMVGGVLLQFFSAVAMAFVGGCMYPAYFFPESLQKLGSILPAGAARLQIAACLTGAGTTQTTRLLLGYSVVFLSLSAAARLYAVRSDRR